MSINKSMSNIVIGFDDRKGVADVFTNYGSDFRKATIEQFKIDKALIKEESNVYDTLNLVLSAFLSDKDLSQPDVYVVLPDYYITIDLVALPYMQQSKMKDALRTELKKMYLNFDELEFNSTIFSKNKKQVVFSCTFVKKSVLTQITSVMKRYNLNLRNVSYESNACVNSFFALGNKVKHSSIIFARIGEDCSSLISINKDKLINFLPLGFGTNVLSYDKRVYESDVESHFTSEFLKFNLSKSSGANHKIEFDYKNDFMEQFKKWQSEEHKRQNDMDDYAYKYENKIAKGSAFVQKAENLEQNFQIFKKYISAFKFNIKQQMGDVKEFAVINLPAKFKTAVSNLREDDLKYFYIDDALIENCYITDFFKLYGMIYAVVYNKGQNFMDKEKQSIFGKIAMNTSFAFRSINNYFANLSKRKTKKSKEK